MFVLFVLYIHIYIHTAQPAGSNLDAGLSGPVLNLLCHHEHIFANLSVSREYHTVLVNSLKLLAPPGALLAGLGPLLAGLGRVLAAVGRSWAALGVLWAALGPLLAALGLLLAAFGPLLGRSRSLLSRSWGAPGLLLWRHKCSQCSIFLQNTVSTKTL